MRLCTFEVSTHLGRHSRAGASKSGVVVDLNFAFAWYMAQSGEPDPQRLADALVPSEMPAFLRAGLRAMHSAEELFLGAGPHPADWWRKDPAPRGPNSETLVYRPDEVRLQAPVPDCGCRESMGAGGEMPSSGGSLEWKPQVVAVGGSYIKPGSGRRDIAGFTLRVFSQRSTVMGPFLATPDEIKDPGAVEIAIRVNGKQWDAGGWLPDLGSRPALRPAEIVAFDLAAPPPLKPGDVIELEAAPLGALRARVS